MTCRFLQVLTRRLLAVVLDAMSAKQRSKLLQVADDAQDASSMKVGAGAALSVGMLRMSEGIHYGDARR